MRKIFFLIITAVFAFSFQNDFLEPEDAFKPSISEQKESILFEINLGQDIYVYHDKLKVFITKPIKQDITHEANISISKPYDGFDVVFDQPRIEVPRSVINSYVKADSYELEFQFQGCSKAGLCYAPMREKKTFSKASSPVKSETKATDSLNETDIIANTLKDANLFMILLTFFGFGLLLSFTPCVFPMIPILSSIIVNEGNQSGMSVKKGFLLSLVYVLAMSLAYTIAGVLAALFGANLQVLLQNPYVLVFFALIFVALAFSMFGFYRIEPPQWLQSKVYRTSSKQKGQGVLGVAIMGFLSALIVGPCVAPPLAAALVYIGQTGDVLLGALALFVLSLGMGLPLLAIGAGAGKYMPKPGGWMDTVSKLFGVLMLAIAIWMLDRVIPNYAIYLWAVLLLATGFYLVRYPHFLVRTVTLLLLVYGTLGFVGAMSGAKNILNPLEKLTATSTSEVRTTSVLQWTYIKNNEALNQAIEQSQKPIMLDFWATWCVSCKELDTFTFQDKRVIEKLKGFTLLKADVTQNTAEDKALQKRFGVFGPPALIFWDENKNEVNEAKIIGYKNADDFLKILNKSF